MTNGLGSFMPSDMTDRSGPEVTAPSTSSMGSSRPPVCIIWAAAVTARALGLLLTRRRLPLTSVGQCGPALKVLRILTGCMVFICCVPPAVARTEACAGESSPAQAQHRPDRADSKPQRLPMHGERLMRQSTDDCATLAVCPLWNDTKLRTQHNTTMSRSANSRMSTASAGLSTHTPVYINDYQSFDPYARSFRSKFRACLLLPPVHARWLAEMPITQPCEAHVRGATQYALMAKDVV